MSRSERTFILVGILCVCCVLLSPETGNLSVCVLLAALATWQLDQRSQGYRDRFAESAPVTGPSGLFFRRFFLTGVHLNEDLFSKLLGAAEDWNEPDLGIQEVCWKYEPDMLPCSFEPEEDTLWVVVNGNRIGQIPADQALSVASWIGEGRIVSARASFSGGPYRRIRNDMVSESSVPFAVEIALAVRCRTCPAV